MKHFQDRALLSEEVAGSSCVVMGLKQLFIIIRVYKNRLDKNVLEF